MDISNKWRSPSRSEFLSMERFRDRLGPYGEGLYWQIRRRYGRPDGRLREVTLEVISKELSINRKTLRYYLNLFFKYNAIGMETHPVDKRRRVWVLRKLKATGNQGK